MSGGLGSQLSGAMKGAEDLEELLSSPNWLWSCGPARIERTAAPLEGLGAFALSSLRLRFAKSVLLRGGASHRQLRVDRRLHRVERVLHFGGFMRE